MSQPTSDYRPTLEYRCPEPGDWYLSPENGYRWPLLSSKGYYQPMYVIIPPTAGEVAR